MTKFFRKYMKSMLAVFMGLLLIVWLGGSALQSLMTGSNNDRLISSSKLGDIVELDRRIANNEITLLQQMGIDWRAPLFGLSGRTQSLGVIEWILLTREAENYGFRVRPVEAEQFLLRNGRTPDVIYNIAKTNDVKVEAIHSAVAKFVAMRKLAGIAVSAPARSEADVRLAARDQLEKVKINLVALKASSFINPDLTFTEDEILAQYDKYRDRDAEGGLKFGYRIAERVRVQYIKVDINELADNVRVPTRTLEKQAREFWRRNKELPIFIKPKDLTPEGEAEGPETPESTSLYFTSFEDAREEAIKAVRKDYAKTKIEDVAGWLARELAEPWYEAEVGDDNYKIGAPDVTAPSYYERVVERLPTALRYGNAATVHTTDIFTKDESFAKAPELSQGTLQGAGSVGARVFRDAAFRVQGIEPMPTEPGAAKSDYLALGQSHPLMLATRDGSRYLFRVIEVKPAGPPESIDQVRDKVIADLRLVAAFESAKVAAEDIVLSITLDGLKAAFDANDEMKEILQPPSGYFTPAPFARSRPGFAGRPAAAAQTTYISGIGRVGRDFIDLCFAMEHEGALAKVVPVEETATVAVVEWVETTPLREDQYKAQRDAIYQQISRTVAARTASEWFDPVRIRDRNGYTATQ